MRLTSFPTAILMHLHAQFSFDMQRHSQLLATCRGSKEPSRPPFHGSKNDQVDYCRAWNRLKAAGGAASLFPRREGALLHNPAISPLWPGEVGASGRCRGSQKVGGGSGPYLYRVASYQRKEGEGGGCSRQAPSRVRRVRTGGGASPQGHSIARTLAMLPLSGLAAGLCGGWATTRRSTAAFGTSCLSGRMCACRWQCRMCSLDQLPSLDHQRLLSRD